LILILEIFDGEQRESCNKEVNFAVCNSSESILSMEFKLSDSQDSRALAFFN